MLQLLQSPTTVAALAAVFLLGYALYRAALPKPIPGIPYHKESANHILGDARAMVKHLQEHGTVTDWFTLQGHKLNSPVFQLFLNPFSKPNVYVLDPRESQDVVLRRAKDFDRSQFFTDSFIGLVPDHHIVQTTNEKFKRGRRLLADTMATGFLHSVAAPSLHKHALKLMELWRVKNALAAGHAFWAADDINHFALDSIWDTSLGTQLNSVGQETELLKSLSKVDTPLSKEEAISLPQPQFSADIESMKVLTDSLDKAIVSPLPRQTHWFIRLTPSYRQARAHKEKLVQASLDDAKARLAHNTTTTTTHDGEKTTSTTDTAEFAGITCATDHMVRREAQAAAKEGRAPVYDSRAAKDELFGFLVGGHDTTATTLMWMIKLLADHPHVQARLRTVLEEAFPGSNNNGGVSGGRGMPPTPEQITRTAAPYLDAVIEEVVRCSQTASVVIRKAVHDTQLLGYPIPRGVDVYLMSNGPGYMAPNDLNETITEDVRSVSSRENKDRAVPNWDPEDIGAFKPERWLKTDGEGREWFDGRAGPTLQFGGGVRGCFGKKLAYLEIRIVLVVLVWTYELLAVPEKLRSYAAVDTLTHKPTACYLRLKEI